METQKTREELLAEITAMDEKRSALRKELQKIDGNKEIERLKKFLGKYYRNKVLPISEDVLYYIFVFGISEEEARLKSLVVSYWPDRNDWFEIKECYSFDPGVWVEDGASIEVSKNEFMTHYNEVQKRISLSLEEKMPADEEITKMFSDKYGSSPVEGSCYPHLESPQYVFYNERWNKT